MVPIDITNSLTLLTVEIGQKHRKRLQSDLLPDAKMNELHISLAFYESSSSDISVKRLFSLFRSPAIFLFPVRLTFISENFCAALLNILNPTVIQNSKYRFTPHSLILFKIIEDERIKSVVLFLRVFINSIFTLVGIFLHQRKCFPE